MQRIYDKYFPFYEDSLRTSPLTVAIPLSKVYFAQEVINSEFSQAIQKAFLEKNLGYVNGFLTEFPNVIGFHKIEPLGLYLPILTKTQCALLYVLKSIEDSDTLDSFFRIDRKRQTIDGSVTIYDYASIADDIQILNLDVEASDKKIQALYLSNSGLDKVSINSIQYIEWAINGIDNGSTYMYERPKESDSIQDAVDIKKIVAEAKAKGIKSKAFTPSESNMERILTALLTGDQRGKKSVPCLVGLSGVAKSSIVKKVAQKLNCRFIDFRAAFLHRLDMEGMFYMVNKEDSPLNYNDTKEVEKFTKQAYLGDFVKCSDQYMDYASRMADKLEMVKNSKEGDDFSDEKVLMVEEGIFDNIDEYITRFRDEARPAVLFFDEIIRAKLKILSLFTILLDVKKFASLTFYKSKICAAANTPHGMANLEQGFDLFVKQELEDPAVFNRLTLIPVTPADMFPSWLEYIKEQNWDPWIIEFVTKGGVNVTYDIAFLDSSLDIEVKRQSTYPTFRSWEMMNKVFGRYRKDKFILKETVVGILGNRSGITEQFITFIESKGVEYSKETTRTRVKTLDDPMMVMAESNIEIGLPTGLFAPSGLGKTTRIEDIKESHGYELITLQMSQKSPSDIMGTPSVVDIQSYMLGDLSRTDSLKESSLFANLAKETLKEVEGLPERVTIRAPQKDLRDKIDKVRAMRSAGINTKLILFFDEVNRIPEGSESVQSAVFEAVSDNRFAGVNFDPDEIAVVCAANINYEGSQEDEHGNISKLDTVDEDLRKLFGEKPSYGDVKPLDSAFKLRLCSMDKESIDESDAVAIKKYVLNPSKKFSESVRQFFKSATPKEVLFYARSAEYKGMMFNVPAIRNFQSLSSAIDDHPELWTGTWFFPSLDELTQFRMDFGNVSNLQEGYTMCLKYLDKAYMFKDWICLKSTQPLPVDVPGMTTPNDVIDGIQELLKIKSQAFDEEVAAFAAILIRAIIRMEDILRDFLTKFVETYIGDRTGTAGRFLDIHTQVTSNIELIEMEGIKNEQTAQLWVERKLREVLDSDTLLSEEYLPCMEYLQKVNKVDCAVYVLIHTLKNMESTVAKVFIKALVTQAAVFEKNDAVFANYNKDVIAAVTTGRSKNLGPQYDVAVRDFTKGNANP